MFSPPIPRVVIKSDEVPKEEVFEILSQQDSICLSIGMLEACDNDDCWTADGHECVCPDLSRELNDCRCLHMSPDRAIEAADALLGMAERLQDAIAARTREAKINAELLSYRNGTAPMPTYWGPLEVLHMYLAEPSRDRATYQRYLAAYPQRERCLRRYTDEENTK